jgi:hypothetical protein
MCCKTPVHAAGRKRKHCSPGQSSKRRKFEIGLKPVSSAVDAADSEGECVAREAALAERRAALADQRKNEEGPYAQSRKEILTELFLQLSLVIYVSLGNF